MDLPREGVHGIALALSSHLASDLSPTRLGPLAGSMAVPLALPQASGVVG